MFSLFPALPPVQPTPNSLSGGHLDSVPGRLPETSDDLRHHLRPGPGHLVHRQLPREQGELDGGRLHLRLLHLHHHVRRREDPLL